MYMLKSVVSAVQKGSIGYVLSVNFRTIFPFKITYTQIGRFSWTHKAQVLD